MQRVTGSTYAVVLTLFAAALLALAWLWAATTSEPVFGRYVFDMINPRIAFAIRAILLGGGAVLCVSLALMLLSGADRGAPAEPYRFGRQPVPASPASEPRRLSRAVALLPALALVLLVAADFEFSTWRTAPGGENVAAGPQPPQDAAEPPAPPAMPELPTLPPGPPEFAQEPTPPTPPAEPPPEVAAVEPAPPQTDAPLPQPPEPAPSKPGGHAEGIDWIAVSPDGTTFMTASIDFTVKLWDFRERRLIRDIARHDDMARAAVYLPDGEHVLTCGDDGVMVLRRLSDGGAIHVFGAKQHGATRNIVLSADGRVAVTAHSSGSVIAWDIPGRRLLHVLAGHVWSVNGIAVTPDGRRAVSGSIDGELRLWDLEKGEQIRQWLGHERGTYSAAFLPDGRVVTGSGDFTVKIWNVDEGRELMRFDGHSGTVYAIDVSDDGKRIVSGSLDGTARIWDVETGRELKQLNPRSGRIYAAAFGPDGTVLTAGDESAVRIWPARTGDEVLLVTGAE